VQLSAFAIFWIVTIPALLVCIGFGYVAATAADGPRKGKARLVASLTFSSLVFLAPALKFAYDRSLPVLQFSGVIHSIRVLDGGRHPSADLQIANSAGSIVTVRASDSSPFFRSGEHVTVHYRDMTRHLIRAEFFTADGHQEGTFHDSFSASEVIVTICGAFCIYASIRKYRRDPEGKESR
jgi:hypothetical protein